jgi:hypothetical protein
MTEPTIPVPGSVPPTFRPDLSHITHLDGTVFQVLAPAVDAEGNPAPAVEWDEAATAAVAAAYIAIHGGD